MRYTQETAKLLHKQELAPGVFNLILSAPVIAGAAAAGQFVNVLCDAYALRRPISICGFDAQTGILRLVFEVRGKGTAWLAQLENGAPVDLIGPLGHGFPLFEPDKRAVLIGGGIGTPPLLPLAQHYAANGDFAGRFRRDRRAHDSVYGRRLRRFPRLYDAGAGAASAEQRVRCGVHLRPEDHDEARGGTRGAAGNPVLCVDGGTHGVWRGRMLGLCLQNQR